MASHMIPIQSRSMEKEKLSLCVTSIPDIFNTGSQLERKPCQTEDRYQFIIDAAKNGTDRGQIIAVKYMLRFYDVFPTKRLEAAKVALALMNINEENLRLTLLADLHVVGTSGGFVKQVIELYLQCTMSNIEEERFLSYDGLVQFLHGHWLDVAGCLRELLNKEHSAKNRKMAMEFLNDRMRIIPFAMYKSKEVLDLLEVIFKEEFARANLTYIDSLFVYLGNSILMDDFERQQSIAAHFIDSLEVAAYLPPYLDEPTTTTAKLPSINADLDIVLVKLTILQQMSTVLHKKSDSVNPWFNFVVDNLQEIFKLPTERETRALRAFAQFTFSCSNGLSDEHVDKLFLLIQELVPSFDHLSEKESSNLPKIDLHRLEPCCIALYNLRHLPCVGEKMTEISEEFRKRMRFLVRYCQLKSTEYKRTVEELGDIPLRKEMNSLVAAATSIGLFALEILKPVESWEMKPRPSWKSCWITRAIPRNPKRIKHSLKCV